MSSTSKPAQDQTRIIYILEIYTHIEPDRPNTKFPNWTDPGFFVQLLRVVGVVGFESIAEGKKIPNCPKIGVLVHPLNK